MRRLAVLGLLLATAPVAAETSPTLTLDLGSSTTMVLLRIPAGSFMMGSPESEPHHQGTERLHRVELSRPYYLGRTEVTVRQYARFVDETGYRTLAEREGWAFGWRGTDWGRVPGMTWRNPSIDQSGPDHPALAIAWEDARAFCRWLSERTGLQADLPTEAQWERACRAGTTTPYFWGTEVHDGLRYANLSDRTTADRFQWSWALAESDGYLFTAPAGSFLPNGYGLHDMAGNVWEWTLDWMGEYPSVPVSDPTGPVSGDQRVIRGGGWGVPPDWCRCATRGFHGPADRTIGIGFRVAAFISLQSEKGGFQKSPSVR